MAAAGAAGMPVRRPRRPAAVSAAVVATAGPGLQLRRLPRARYRPVDDETKPELPLREAPGSLSIDLDLGHEPRELLGSARSHETSLPPLSTSLTVNGNS